MRAFAGLLPVLLALTGCGDDPFTSAEERALSLQCFCEPSRPDFTRLEVQDGEVVAAEYLGEPSDQTETHWRHGPPCRMRLT